MLKFEPIYMNKIWGGRRFEETFGRTMPAGKIGESWELVDSEEAQSVVAEGECKGTGLKTLWQEGALGGSATGAFPFLLKWLDTHEDMSVQVHPDEEFCRNTRLGHPKTEAWYCAYVQPKAKLRVGNYPGLDANTLEQVVARGSLRKWMYEASPRQGDLYLIEAGTLHCVGAGFLLLEIQQPSDTTFRVYDWDREDGEGNKRELHLEEASAAVRYNRIDLPQPHREGVVGPGFSLKPIQMGASLPDPSTLRVIVSLSAKCRLVGDTLDVVVPEGDVVVLQPSDGQVALAGGQAILASEGTPEPSS